MHARIVSNFAFKFVVMGLPAIGIIMAESMTWNIVWWVIYFLWGWLFAKQEIISKTVIGTMWVQLPFIILIEMEQEHVLLWVGAGLWAGIVYLTIYRQAASMNALTEDLEATDTK